MKTILLTLVVLSINLFAQSNPDGDAVSFHLSPYISSGGESVDDEEVADYSGNYGILLLIKFPLNQAITLSPFYEYTTFSYTSTIAGSIDNVTFKRRETKAGFTISLYVD